MRDTSLRMASEHSGTVDVAPKEPTVVARLIRAGGWGVLDQGLISACNFVVLVVLARTLAPSAFGEFTLVYAAMLVANYAQTAFITQPHNVLGARLGGREYRVYTRSSAIAQLGLSGLLSAAFVSAALVLAAVGLQSASVVAIAALALPLWQLQEFVRRVLYTEGRQSGALANDVLAYGGWTCGVVALALDGALSPARTLGVMAVSSAAAAAIGFRQIQQTLERADWSRVPVVENVAFGKWLMGSFAAQWIAFQAYLFLAAIVLGVAVTGGLKAVQLVLSPLHVLMFSLATMLPIRLSRSLARDAEGVRLGLFSRDARLALSLTFPAVMIYCGFVALFADEILELLYGPPYDAFGQVLVLFAAYYVLLYAAFFASALLTAERRTSRLFAANAAAAAVSLAACWPLMSSFGAKGATVALLLSAVTLNVVLWRPDWASFDS